jgi:hypothetical protein
MERCLLHQAGILRDALERNTGAHVAVWLADQALE